MLKREKKWTKGPWVAWQTPDRDLGHEGYWCGATPANESAGDVAKCSGFDGKRSNDEEMSNARLIAAAPDLVEALEVLLPYIEGAENAPLGYCAAARAALAKAYGEGET